MVNRFSDEQEDVDFIWHTYIGSHFLSPKVELAIIRRLKKENNLPFSQVYELYLKSKIWKSKRYKVLQRDDHKCVKCGSVQELHVDHLRYPGFGNETLDDLQTLCAVCHAEKTHYWDMASKRKPRKLKVSSSNQLFNMLRRKN